MNPQYQLWIVQNVTDARGRCVETTRQMARAFPELRRVRGHAHCPIQNRAIPHWWLVAPSGDVVDPTAEQFECPSMVTYEEYTGPEPTGHCLDCGALLYDERQTFCNDACRDATMRYLRSGGQIFVNGERVL